MSERFYFHYWLHTSYSTEYEAPWKKPSVISNYVRKTLAVAIKPIWKIRAGRVKGDKPRPALGEWRLWIPPNKKLPKIWRKCKNFKNIMTNIRTEIIRKHINACRINLSWVWQRIYLMIKQSGGVLLRDAGTHHIPVVAHGTMSSMKGFSLHHRFTNWIPAFMPWSFAHQSWGIWMEQGNMKTRLPLWMAPVEK